MRKQAPICRWLIDGLMVDIIQVISAPFFIGTKLEAFAGRGQGDYLFSHDMGDIISIVDGRESLVLECRSAPLELQMYLSGQFDELMKTEVFTDALPGHLPSDAASQQRLPELKAKLKALADMRP